MEKRKVKKLVVRIVLSLLGFVLLLTVGASIYFYQNKKEFVSQLTSLYNSYTPGTITYDDVDIKPWATFPQAALSFKNLSVVDTSTTKHSRFHAEEVDLYLSLASILRKRIQIKSVRVSRGTLDLDDYSPLSEQEIRGQVETSDSLVDTRSTFRSYFKKETKLEIDEFQINIRNEVKNKFFGFKLKKFHSVAEFEDDVIKADSEMEVDLQALGFNLDKGTFGNGAQLSGSFSSTLNLDTSELDIEPFDLQIDDQAFKLDINFILKKQTQFSIVFENEQTRFAPSIGLLSRNIAEKLRQFDLSEPVNTRISLEGRFVFKGNPVVQVEFETAGNNLTLHDSIPINNLALKGRFINRFFDDERAIKEEIKNYRVNLDEFKGSYRDLDFELNNFLVFTGPEAENQIHTEINSSGAPTEFNNIFQNQFLSFDKGNYEISLEIDGDLVSTAELLERSSGQILIANTEITNRNNGVSIPVKELSASLQQNQAELKRLEVPLNSRDEIVISGQIRNVSGLLRKEDRKSVRSDLIMESDNLVWDDFLALYEIGKQDPAKKEKRSKQVLRDALISIYNNYNPSIDIKLKNFQFRQLNMRNFETGVSFEHQNSIKLDETNFEVDGGKFKLNASLDLEKEGVVGLDALLEGTGDVSFLDGLFEEKVFAIEKGNFKLSAIFKGDILKSKEIIRQSVLNFNLYDTEFLYKPEDVRIPVINLEMDLINDIATLKNLRLNMGEEDQIELTGTMNNFSSLLFDRERGKVDSRINIFSNHLEWDNFLYLFSADKLATSSEEEKIRSEQKLKKTLQDVYLSVNPDFEVDIKEFDYRDTVTFRDFHTEVFFKDLNTVVFDKTSVEFGKKGKVILNAEIDISKEMETPVSLELEAMGEPEDLDLVFNESAFSMGGGQFDLKTKAEGDILKLDHLIANSESHLLVENSNFFHEPSGVSIPCRVLDVTLENNNANLNNFTAVLPSGHEMKFSGVMKNASYLFLKDVSDAPPLQSELLMESEALVFDEFVDLFKLERKEGTEEGQPIVLKQAFKDFYLRYQPSLKVAVDEFIYDNLYLQNLVSGFHFENENQFYLESTAFDFYDGKVGLDAHFDLTDPDLTPFAFGFSTETLDLEQLLEAFEYFGMDSLEEADKIGGNVTINSVLQGDIIDSTGIDINSMIGRINFDLEELRLVGFEPLITVAKKVFKKERFQDIRFQPITDTLYLSNATLEIPLMEIQSTAIQLFVIGHLGFEDVKTNIWTAIPLSNFKSRDLKQLPDKKGYIESGKNVYVEAKTARDGSIKYVLHLTPKKYYQERGLISNYREEIRNYRYQRRRHKRDTKKSERQNRKTDSSPD